MRLALFLLTLLSIPTESEASFFGEENIPLYRLVIGQLAELEKLAEALGVAREHLETLRELNEGIDGVIQELNTLEDIVTRAQRLDPRSIQRLSDVTRIINDTKSIARDLDALLEARLSLAEEAVVAGSIQAQTSYSVGQEMVSTGARLSLEAKTASPGRATQIAAGALSTQVVGMGTMLQTLSHLTELQAMETELKRGELEQSRIQAKEQRKAARKFLYRGKRK